MTVAGKDPIPRTEPLRILIPLNGSDGDVSALHLAAEMVARDAEIFLLLARSGPDEERHPGLREGMSEAERTQRRLECERTFAQANAILASRGLISAEQLETQGKPAEIILRVAKTMGAELIVMAASGARHVIDYASCAVLVADPGAARGKYG